MRYELVIFDNDGVLVDSEPISNQILAGYLTELGHPTSYEESIRDYMGSAMHRVHELVMERSDQKLPADFNETFHSRVFDAFRRTLQPVAGIGSVLDDIVSRSIPYCLASSGSHERIRVALRTTGLYSYFDEERIFSSQDVGRGKPEPDLFLYAAKSMGVRPERCAVIEDSPAGVQAAVAAGMDVYGFTAMTPPAELAGATALFADMSELSRLLG
ncbi:HAD family hydrolase [Streptantibioticus ferralitis]|uniref:HAD family hydrolase n=1 Tax=Streptantibioticus ferralitis TaxID=236510 RepID=A0ABT5Z7H0_9ACTN|nr:HAD family hydrolase [Streptantibioticus ferralitis]MDF2259776.1 HAD family hydrolase [Streptantibioticus ferralitis]